MRLILSLLALCLGCATAWGQELRAEVKVSTEALGAVDRSRYAELERELSDLLNNTRFTTDTYAPAERIVCSFTLQLRSVESDSRYTAELTVSASRPVYGTSYTTPLFVYRDRELTFDYSPGLHLEYNAQQLDNQLVAAIVAYAQLIIAIDMDSFAPLGGNALRDGLSQLLSIAQGKPDWKGWRTFSGDNSRGTLISALLDGGHEPLRNMWYRYHRHGLDRLEAEPSIGRAELITQLESLLSFRREHPASPYFTLVEQTKAGELRQLFDAAPTDDKRRATELLRQLFPR